MDKEYLSKVIRGCKTNKQVRDALRKNKIEYEDQSWDSDSGEVLSLYVGLLRIYKPYNQKHFVVKQMERVTFEYSGIPTFMPSGRNTFSDIL